MSQEDIALIQENETNIAEIFKRLDRLEKDLGVQKVEWLKTVDKVGKQMNFLMENYHLLTRLLNQHLNKSKEAGD